MNTKPIWEFLFSLNLGSVVAWISVICAIITAFFIGLVKIYKVFLKYQTAMNQNIEFKKMVTEHDKKFEKLDEVLSNIKKSLDEQKEVNLKQIRHTIVHDCNEALDKGSISASKFKSLQEMYEEYVTVFHGNWYVSSLMKRVECIPIVGVIDE